MHNPVILTGDRPTGKLHIGHYVGSLRQRVAAQHHYRQFVMIADLQALTDNGLRVVGRSLDGKFVEIAELPEHPWYVAVQFHPEFKSRPFAPHPLFVSFVEAAINGKQKSKNKPQRKIKAA